MLISVKSLILKKNKYVITFSNDKEITCNEELVLKYRLIKGKELDDELLDSIEEDSKWYNFYERALNYLEKGLKSSERIRLYLLEHDATKEQADLVVNELTEKRILDDKEYFKELTSHYVRQSYGKLYIKSKGISEHISSLIIEECLNEIDYLEYKEYAQKLKDKKLSLLKSNDFVGKMKIKKYLLSRGYEYDLINDIFKE